MDEARLKEMLDEVRREIASARHQLKELRRVESFLIRRIAREATPLFDHIEPHAMPQAVVPHRTNADWAALVLQEHGGPLNTQLLVSMMIDRGYPNRGDRKQLVNTIFSIMRRTPERFKKVEKGMWDLVHREGRE